MPSGSKCCGLFDGCVASRSDANLLARCGGPPQPFIKTPGLCPRTVRPGGSGADGMPALEDAIPANEHRPAQASAVRPK
jgi:hypothetical protein